MISPDRYVRGLRSLGKAWRAKYRLCFLPWYLIFDNGVRRYVTKDDTDRDPFSARRRIPGKDPRDRFDPRRRISTKGR